MSSSESRDSNAKGNKTSSPASAQNGKSAGTTSSSPQSTLNVNQRSPQGQSTNLPALAHATPSDLVNPLNPQAHLATAGPALVPSTAPQDDSSDDDYLSVAMELAQHLPPSTRPAIVSPAQPSAPLPAARPPRPTLDVVPPTPQLYRTSIAALPDTPMLANRAPAVNPNPSVSLLAGAASNRAIRNATPELSLFSVIQQLVTWTLTLFNVPDFVHEGDLKQYSVQNNLHIPISVRLFGGMALLGYATEAQYLKALHHRWGYGTVHCPPGYVPTARQDVFYRIIYACIATVIENLAQRIAAEFLNLHIEVRSAGRTRNPEMIMVYFATLEDFVRAATYSENEGTIVIPAFGNDTLPTALSPILALAATNADDIHKLQVRNLPQGYDVGRLLALIRRQAEATGFNEEDVLFVAPYLPRGSTRPAKYAFVFVRGIDLAHSLAGTAIRTSNVVLKIKLAPSKDSEDHDEQKKDDSRKRRRFQ